MRALVEQRCGSPVVDAVSQGGGFTPGFASVLTCADGTRHFVKAASAKAQRMFADSYREEARKLQALPVGVPAPAAAVGRGRRLGRARDSSTSRRARRGAPGGRPTSTPVLDALEVVARELTPAPEELHAGHRSPTSWPTWPAYWEHVAATRPDLPHLVEAAALAAGFAKVVGGRHRRAHRRARRQHPVRPDGTAVFCDWNWPVVGAAWLDSLFVLIGPRGDGLDVDAVLATRPLTPRRAGRDVDAVLALLIGYFFKSGDDPVPPTSPHLRDHQRWQGEVLWQWLCERRGW